jgi:hypothetical protein
MESLANMIRLRIGLMGLPLCILLLPGTICLADSNDAQQGAIDINHSVHADGMTTPEMMPAMIMPGWYGPYPMSREASGTSWQPDSTPMEGLHWMGDLWSTMWHGLANLIYDD